MFKRKPDAEAERWAASERLADAQKRLKALEQQAGIREYTDSLADRERDTSEELREAVFGVRDTALRRQIMQAHRDCEVAHAATRLANGDTIRYKDVVKNYGRSRRSQAFIGYSAFAALLVLVGQFIGHPWEVVGAAVGIVWAIVDMPRVEQEIARTIEEHKLLLADSQKSDAEWARAKPLFSDSEIASGVRGPSPRAATK